MGEKQLHIHFQGKGAAYAWDDARVLDVPEYVYDPDNPTGDATWHSVELGNGEEIELMLSQQHERIQVNVRQGMQPIFQILGGDFASICFNTLSGASINIKWIDSDYL